jgi:N-acylneuraminate cytidylyltransferase
MILEKFDSVVPVVKFGNSVLRSLKLQNGKLILNFPEYENHRSQDLPVAYHDSGQFYWFKVQDFLRLKRFIYK